MADAGQEPSMEEILSSIKRIIAEDSDAMLSSPRAKRSVGLSPMTVPPTTVLPVTMPTGQPPVAQTDDDDSAEPDVLELTNPVAVDADPVPPQAEAKPMPKADVAPTAQKTAAPAAPSLVSETTVEASRSSLAALSALVVKPEVAGSDTLEGLVRDMLKPMLAAWLDARLPEVVERIVAQEIARITDRG